MSFLRTWHEYGGYNFQKASAIFDSAEHNEARIAAISSGISKKHQDAEYRTKHLVGVRKNAGNSMWLDALRSRSQSPEERVARSARMVKVHSDPAFEIRRAAAIREAMLKRYQDPVFRAKHAAAMRKKA